MARTGCIYGDSGVLKSTQAKWFSHYIYELTGKKCLLVSMDGGGWAPMQPEIDAGIIKAYRCTTEIPLPVLRKISQGYFPRDEKATRPEDIDMRLVDWKEFGGVIVEGITSISQSIMRHLADKGIKTGEEATNQFAQSIIIDGQLAQEKFAGNSRGHYGFVQNALYSMIMNFSALPCDYVLFTALESRTEEDDRSTVYGPQVAGKKATNMVPSWVGDCLHGQGFPVERAISVPDPKDPTKKISSTVIDTVVRYYFTKHPDPVTGIMFPAKPRVTPEQIPSLMKIYPGGYFEPTLTDGFDKYLKAIDTLGGKQVDELMKWREQMDAKFGRGKHLGGLTPVDNNVIAAK